MSEQDFYITLFNEKIFNPFMYELGNVPKKITFSEFVFEFVESPNDRSNSTVIISYYKEDAFIPENILRSIDKVYITSACGIYSEPKCITTKLDVTSCKKLYIKEKLGLRIFIEEMKEYFTRVYKPAYTREKIKQS